MRQVATALIAFIIATSLVSAFSASRHSATVGIQQSTQTITADTFYSNVITTVLADVVAQVQTAPTTKISTLPNVTGTGGESATVAVNGDTTIAGTNATAANLNLTINQRRVALTITETPATHLAPITHRVTVLVQNSISGYTAKVDTDTVIDSSSTASTIVSADTNGCAGTGLGCDPNGVQAADSSLTPSAIQCNTGYGSGTCPPGNQIPNPVYTTTPWTNNQ
jgi:hypothetical protein